MQKPIFLNDSDTVFFYPSIIPNTTATYFYFELLKTTAWRQESLKLYGKNLLIPRLSAWHGDAYYNFSGLKMKPKPWNPTLCRLKNIAQKMAGVKFNSVLLNLYRNGQDSIAWHSDDEPELGGAPEIASISLGFERKFRFRNKSNKTHTITLKLKNGSLLHMTGSTQQNWEHCIPKTSRIVGPRINLTFRQVFN